MKPPAFIRLNRPSTGSSFTVPASLNPDVDAALARGLQNEFINCGFVVEHRYYTEQQLKDEHNFEYIHEFDNLLETDLDAEM